MAKFLSQMKVLIKIVRIIGVEMEIRVYCGPLFRGESFSVSLNK